MSRQLGYQLPIGKLTDFAYLLDFDPLTRSPGSTAAQFNAVEPLRMSSATWASPCTTTFLSLPAEGQFSRAAAVHAFGQLYLIFADRDAAGAGHIEPGGDRA